MYTYEQDISFFLKEDISVNILFNKGILLFVKEKADMKTCDISNVKGRLKLLCNVQYPELSYVTKIQ